MAVILLTYKKYPKSSGGVAKHAEHLKRSFPQAKHFCWEDFPDHRAYDSISEPPKAKKLTHWLAERGHIVKSDLVIADGFWFADLKKIGCTIFSVIHGTFAGWIGQNHPLSQAQKDIIPNADRWIAVSPFAQYEAKKYYGINAEIILNGVDLSIFKPDPAIKKTFDFVDMATNTDKGSGLTSVLKKHFKGYSINGRGHKEIPHLLNQARVFVSPSRYEGNSYAILEAIACGLSIVSSPTGLFWPYTPRGTSREEFFHTLSKTLPGRNLSGYKIEDWTAAVKDSVDHAYAPEKSREWAVKYLSLERFIREWRGKV